VKFDHDRLAYVLSKRLQFKGGRNSTELDEIEHKITARAAQNISSLIIVIHHSTRNDLPANMSPLHLGSYQVKSSQPSPMYPVQLRSVQLTRYLLYSSLIIPPNATRRISQLTYRLVLSPPANPRNAMPQPSAPRNACMPTNQVLMTKENNCCDKVFFVRDMYRADFSKVRGY